MLLHLLIQQCKYLKVYNTWMFGIVLVSVLTFSAEFWLTSCLVQLVKLGLALFCSACSVLLIVYLVVIWYFRTFSVVLVQFRHETSGLFYCGFVFVFLLTCVLVFQWSTRPVVAVLFKVICKYSYVTSTWLVEPFTSGWWLATGHNLNFLQLSSLVKRYVKLFCSYLLYNTFLF